MISNQFDFLFTTDKLIQHKREQDFGLCGVLKILNGRDKILYLYNIYITVIGACTTVLLFFINFYHIRFF